MMMVQKWTGRESLALREAMRVSQRDFADQLGITGRAVAKWEAGGTSLVPRPDSQAILDTKLRQVPDEVRTRFEQILGIGPDEADSTPTAPTPDPEAGKAAKAAPTLLSVLLGERHWKQYRTFDAQFRRAARELAAQEEEPWIADLTMSERTFERWAFGQVKRMPHPDASRVLEHMFGYPVQELLSCAGTLDRADTPHTAAARTTDENPGRHGEIVKEAAQVNVVPRPAQRPLTTGAVASAQQARPEPTAEVASEEDQEEMERRRLLQSLATLGVSVTPLSDALETVRTMLGVAVGYDERADLDSWEDTVKEYGYSYLSSSPLNLIPDLASDLVTVRSIIRRVSRDTPEYRSWCRIGGTISALVAKCLSNAGQARESRHWWEMAQHMSDISGDISLGLWMRKERIVHGLYENRPVQVLLGQLKKADEYGRGHACAGLAGIYATGSQVSVLSGDYQSAEEGLRKSGEILARLPASVTGDTSSVMGWGEDRLRYTETWVYSHLGDEARADRAAENALSLYPKSDSRSPVQIKLMQAFGRIQSGDISEGIRSAQGVYESLASASRTTMVDALALRVHASVPAEARKRVDVSEYHELVATAPRKIITS